MVAKRMFVVLFISVFLFILSPGCSQTSAIPGSIALVNCRLIDGTGAQPVENAVVLISNGKILQAGSADSVPVPKGAKAVDLKGATALPGFINAHVHRAYDEQNLKSWLKAGVTTVRDEAPFSVGNFLSERDRLNKDASNTMIVSATPILTVPGGYGTASFTSADEAKQSVDKYINKGVDIVKFSIEDDQQGRTWTMPTFDEVKAIVDAAHAKKLKVSVHVTRERNLRWAIDCGVDDIAHMVVEPISIDTAKEIADKGIYWEPTLELWNGVSSDYSLNWVDVAVSNLSIFYREGGKIALGTDFAGYTCSFDKGFPITEVNLMKQAGMSNMDIIVAGTKNAAHVCSRDAVIGTIEEGKFADLLIVNGDPLTDLNALLNVRMVVHGGTVVVDNQ
jgi:imidazolonepropionase-like amidohydrolase